MAKSFGILGWLGIAVMVLTLACLALLTAFFSMWLSPEFHVPDFADPAIAPIYQVGAVAFLIGLMLVLVDRWKSLS